MTILEALQWANNKLKKTGIESPMLDAELLLAAVLDVPKSWLFGHIADDLKPHQEEKFFILVDRRMKREPVAYLINKKSFYGRDFFVDPSVLIPRPATETMIEQALEVFSTCDRDKTLFVDIGTGSGAIAITLAAETQTPVLAIDVDQSALVIAKRNAQTFTVEEQIDFQHGSLLEPLVNLFETIRASGNPNISSVYPFKDLIVCANLPYLTTSQMDVLDPDVRFEPVRALVAGVDGLDAYWDLFRQCKKHRDLLPRNITVLIEIDPDQLDRSTQLIKHYFPEASMRTEKDIQKHDRVVIAEL
ncbi:protein-(glutamine-N5) methyltransferase, release factor-specific [Candidatus Uhrbacteria bacterium RIFCSPHIGHO2_02_FULL_47_44]|uniref:Protein-(Glutamine-N5) methyltransferase, release factor-specific n=1 Tax=Candidatus Uhrbacteria bacterium RIFCSPLOWO2_02_FULL_48_18 TaxID=1802408 RepID=A0A1F7VAC5_9BACT|nr:MAG: protein-(glutamine-N5) methyltransferase, release factor-specific [Candidatus Uhrbacteria bacterium RIFCSPHIGHO2_01_FULL_47_10]OGL71350.1 MAG: protein-(glutamine-N5) methyltransferase, release factor-specific [Candidatus Uhrbacteria bacterium RIFCSPHIGHO2_02_FULL_47_44]OGL77401.1 MAG: protein-(glutamine-N5) methyltransferase, release factor-specific [Candidatus Uhrbacteria bacterium RIFCSPHIGHO2_12_FULL_47_12]OGL81761.1 MAG: protein-(glutamine-N5) methyltransferase, release factor-specif